MKKYISKIPHKKIMISSLICLAFLTWLMFFIPPSNLYIILTYILLLSCFCYLVSSLFLNNIRRIVVALFIFTLLSINGYLGFNVLNCILLFFLFLVFFFLVQ